MKNKDLYIPLEKAADRLLMLNHLGPLAFGGESDGHA